ncbi:MAG TPA: sigma-70 family RNA polymerase sigma factor [Anaerolineales bacterium]|nr:sigma-70 family RNA polymerase sigma factor [Anaerolineales bacterium]
MKRLNRGKELDLIQHARLHDERAFAELVEAYTLAVYRITRRMVTDTLEAESIVQETFWRFWQKLPRYQTDAPLLPYLATIASNLARDRYRRERWLDDEVAENVLENRADEGPEPEAQFDQKQTLERLAAAVESLPIGYRAVIALRYDAGLDYEEIAQALSMPLNTVRTHLRRAKQKLKERMEADDG